MPHFTHQWVLSGDPISDTDYWAHSVQLEDQKDIPPDV